MDSNFIESNYDKFFNLIFSQLVIGTKLSDKTIATNVKFELNNSFLFNTELGLKIILTMVLFEIRGYNNVRDILKITSDASIVNILTNNLSNLSINEKMIDEFIENNVIKNNNQVDMPIEILKTMKNKIYNDVFGYLGITDGNVLRNISNKDASMLTPTLAIKDQASDTLERFKLTYEDIIKNAKENNEDTENVTFEKVYPRLALTNIDQLQLLLLTLRNSKDIPGINMFTISYKIPHFNLIPNISLANNLWCNKKVMGNDILTMSFIKIDDKLEVIVNLEKFVAHPDSLAFITYNQIFLSIISKALNFPISKIVWNIGLLIMPNPTNKDTLIEEIKSALPTDNKKYYLNIKDFDDITQLTLEHFEFWSK